MLRYVSVICLTHNSLYFAHSVNATTLPLTALQHSTLGSNTLEFCHKTYSSLTKVESLKFLCKLADVLVLLVNTTKFRHLMLSIVLS